MEPSQLNHMPLTLRPLFSCSRICAWFFNWPTNLMDNIKAEISNIGYSKPRPKGSSSFIDAIVYNETSSELSSPSV